MDKNWNDASRTVGYTVIDNKSPLMILCPNSLKPTLVYLTSYLTQGYYAFSMSLDLDFEPMYGLGNSMFIMANIDEFFNIDLYSKTYQSRMSVYGWDSSANWHSFYVWVANDVHFLGVVIIMFFIGYLLGSLYKDVVVYNNIGSLPLLCLLFILLFYLPANNQVLSYPATFFVFWFLLFYFLLNRKKYRAI